MVLVLMYPLFLAGTQFMCVTTSQLYYTSQCPVANNKSSEVIDILLPFILTLRPGLIMSKTCDDFLLAARCNQTSLVATVCVRWVFNLIRIFIKPGFYKIPWSISAQHK